MFVNGLPEKIGENVKFRGFRKDRRHLAAYQSDLEYWWRQPLGRALLETQQERLEPFLSRTFGYHFLQLGVSPYVSLTHLSQIKHPMIWSGNWVKDAGQSVLVSDAHALPLPDDSVDVVLIHHLLDFVDNPHQVLREAARITQHKGHLIIVGFNPVSSWGLCRALPLKKKKVPWNGRFLSVRRLHDWLTLLDYRIEDVETLMARPPINSSRWLERTRWLESVRRGGRFGGCYIVWAKKQVGCATPLRKQWNQNQFIPGGIVSPSTKGVSGIHNVAGHNDD